MNSTQYQQYLASREWAVLREQVRERSGNCCERCRQRPQDAVHHLTYQRVGREHLDDLQAICDSCHEFLSGKRSVDPVVDGIKVYLAGPISGTRWRDDLLREDVGWSKGGNNNFLPPGTVTWPVNRGGLIGGFDFAGPWFIDTCGGHGGPLRAGLHGDDSVQVEHGCPLETDLCKVIRCCQRAIEMSNVVFAWLGPDGNGVPGGTIWEMGYATAYGKVVVAALPAEPPNSGDLWFAELAATHVVYGRNARDAWDDFCAWWPGPR